VVTSSALVPRRRHHESAGDVEHSGESQPLLLTSERMAANPWLYVEDSEGAAPGPGRQTPRAHCGGGDHTETPRILVVASCVRQLPRMRIGLLGDEHTVRRCRRPTNHPARLLRPEISTDQAQE